ncbi:NB-ARC domain-containing protein [Streptomyces sp. NPDC048219]|uniref:NB-ARC domain-containing protein n=1 Tax=unclassified Streptomyces TaxID=2593676 RepID=UPI00341FFCB6
MADADPRGKDGAGSPVKNQISGGVFFSTVIQGRDITVQLPRAVPTALSGLPATSSSFTGRDEELSVLMGLLNPDSRGPRAVAVSAVVGLAGVGKTELVLQAAHTAVARGWYPGGVLFADIHGYDEDRRPSPGSVLGSWLSALGIATKDIPVEEQDRARLYTSVLAALTEHDRRLLVVVDNASSAGQVRPLLPSDGSTRVIVTSRHTLGTLDARLVELDVLAPQTAVELVNNVVQVTRGADDRVSRYPQDAARVARLCGHLPLALRIVAASLAEDPARPLAELAADLAQERSRLEELRYDDLAVRAAFELSYRHLTPDQAWVFQLLPINPGPDLATQAVAALAEREVPATRRALTELARAHLVERDTAHGDGYWRMHDLVRLYANERRDSDLRPQEIRAAACRLFAHYLDSSRHGHAVNQTELMTKLTAGPIGQQFTYADSEPAQQAIAHLRQATTILRKLDDREAEGQALAEFTALLVDTGRYGEAFELHQRIDEISAELSQASLAQAQINIGIAYARRQRRSEATEALRRAAGAYRNADDKPGEFAALFLLASLLVGTWPVREVIAVGQRAESLADRAANQWGLDPITRARIASRLGDVVALAKRADEVLKANLKGSAGWSIQEKHAHGITAGLLLSEAGQYEDALAIISSIASHPLNRHNSVGSMGESTLNSVRERVIEVYRRDAQAAKAMRDDHTEGALLVELGIRYGQEGDYQQAIMVLRTALPLLHESANKKNLAKAYWGLGFGHLKLGERIEAIDLFESGLSVAESIGDRQLIEKFERILAEASGKTETKSGWKWNGSGWSRRSSWSRPADD